MLMSVVIVTEDVITSVSTHKARTNASVMKGIHCDLIDVPANEVIITSTYLLRNSSKGKR